MIAINYTALTIIVSASLVCGFGFSKLIKAFQGDEKKETDLVTNNECTARRRATDREIMDIKKSWEIYRKENRESMYKIFDKLDKLTEKLTAMTAVSEYKEKTINQGAVKS